MTNLEHGATAETTRQADGTYNVTVKVGIYETTLQHNASEAEAMQKAVDLLPMFIAEANEYIAMQF
jgi:hypothetical protein